MTAPEIERDTEALVALALTRQGWTEPDIRAAINDATACQMSWPVILTGVVHLMRTPDSEPRHLVSAHQRRNAGHAAGRRNTEPETDWPMGRIDG